jgi:hypothetical protein
LKAYQTAVASSLITRTLRRYNPLPLSSNERYLVDSEAPEAK